MCGNEDTLKHTQMRVDTGETYGEALLFILFIGCVYCQGIPVTALSKNLEATEQRGSWR